MMMMMTTWSKCKGVEGYLGMVCIDVFEVDRGCLEGQEENVVNFKESHHAN